MGRSKFYYDKKSLSYKEIKLSKKDRFLNFLSFFLASFFFGTICLLILISTPLINTPTELSQARELNNFELQFDILNKKLAQLENVLENIEERDNNIYRVLFEANPIDEDIRKAGFGGVNRYANLEGYENSELVVETTKKIDILTKQLVIQSKSLDEILSLAEEKENLLASIPSIQPIQNKDLKRMASGYGWRIDPFTKKRRRHFGMDFSAVRGTPVYATGNGIIKRVDNRAAGFGKHIRIDHGFGYVSIYAHLDKYNVKRGQKVKRGQIIGFVGNTGRSVAPHLHYEIVKDGKKINPINFYYGNLSPDEFNILVQQASQENESLD